MKIGQLGILSRGVTYSPPEDLRSESDSTSIWLLRSTNLQGGEINLDDVTIVAAHCAKPNQRLANGDIAICTANGSKALVGKASLVCLPNPSQYVVGAFCARMRPNDGESPEFLAALFESGFYKSWIGRLLAGTNINNLKPSDIASCSIRMPSSLAQRNRLGEIFSLSRLQIKTLDRLIAAKREQKRGLMQQLLTGKLRFPGFTEPWKTVRIDQLGVVKSGGTPSTDTPEYWGGVHSWCTPTDVTALNTRYLKKTTRTISDSGVKFSAAELLPPQSVIVCTRATVGIAAINTIPMATNQGFKSIIPGLDVDTDFLYYAIMFVKRELLRRAAGSTFLEVSLTSFREIPILWPSSLNEQKRVSRFLGALDHEIELLAQQRAAFAAQRRGLMEKLLSGEIDIQNPKETAA